MERKFKKQQVQIPIKQVLNNETKKNKSLKKIKKIQIKFLNLS